MKILSSEKHFSPALVLGLLLAVAIPLVLSQRLVRSGLARPIASGSNAPVSDAAGIAQRYGKLPLRFEVNQGQTDSQVKFLSRGPGYDLFLTATEAVLTLRKPQSPQPDQPGTPEAAKDASSNSMRESSVLRLKMIGANPGATVEGREPLSGRVNYLIGNEPDKWHANIPTYGKVYYKEIYPGVDMIYYGNQQELEYDFVIAPDADPRLVKFNLEGAQRLRIDGKGNLVITIDHSEVKLRKPVIYQISDQGERSEVIGNYSLRGSEVGFSVKNYNAKKALIIDPILSYSTYFGPSALARAIAVDASGNAYLTGSAGFGNFPTTPGALKTNGSQDTPDAFVTKMNSSGSELVYSTYLGGRGQDIGNGIAVDSSGNAFITGDTQSANFPTVNPIRSSTSNFLQTVDSGGHWSGQFIGPPNGLVNVLVVDPLTPNTMYAGMGSNGGGGVYKTTDGGLNWIGLNTGVTNANCPAMVIDPATPSTLYASLNPPNPPGAGLYKSIDGGSTWTILTNGLSGVTVSALAIDPLSPSTVYAGASFIGLYKSTNSGASWTNSSTGINFGGFSSIAVDPANSAIVYASAGGGGVFKTTNGAGNWGQVNTGLTNTNIRVLKIDSASNVYAGSSGGGLFKSTNGGGNWSPLNNGLPTFTSVSSLALNSNGSTIFMGTLDGKIYKSIDSGGSWTISYETLTRTSFNSLITNPTNSSVLYAGAANRNDPLSDHEAFIAKLNPTGSALVYSTYLGGDKDDIGRGVAVDSAGNAYVAGQTSSTSFPLAAAFQSTLKGTADAFVTLLNPAGTALVYSTFLGGDGFENANAIATDGGGNAYVTGSTDSANFPLANAFQSTRGGTFGPDAFATKFSSTGALAYSTYLGGDEGDTGYGIAADSSGNAVVAGASNSSNFPTANAIQATPVGGFVTKLNNLGSGLVYSTYLGDSRGIALDSASDAYVTGFTSSSAFPLVAGSLRTKSVFFTSTNSGGSWNNDNYGLKAGIVTAIALDPTNPSTIYAGTQSGVSRSTDGGRNWTTGNTGLIEPSIVGLVVDPATPTTVYLGARLGGFSTSLGVYKSTNGGSSWSPVNNGLGNGGVQSLAIDPVTSTLYAGVNGGSGLAKTTNGGSSWIPITTPFGVVGSIVIDPVTPSTIYIGSLGGGGVARSLDGGANWQVVNNGLANTSINSLAIDPITPSTIYAGVNGVLFKSVNSGNSWTASNNGLGSRTIRAIAIDPVTPSTIYVASNGLDDGVFRSINGGGNWARVSNGIRPGFVFSIAVNPLQTSTVYLGLQSFGSTDNDAFVTKINPSGSAFIYSTLLGGNPAPGDSSNLNDEGYGIAVDLSGNAYVTGSTRALDFPTTPDAYLPYPVASSFVSKLAISYLISGQVLDGSNAPVSGAEVVLSDGVSLSLVVTGSDGSYQFSQLREGGSFIVSASKPHFTMTPASQTFNNLNSNQTLNFIATATAAPFYLIRGTVTNNGAGLSGVTVTLGGSQPSLRTTDSNGNYSFTVAGGGSYSVTPALLGFSFSPPSLTFNNLGSDQTTANFTAVRQDFVVTNANDHGTGSFRQAMLDANATAGLDTIVFNIPGAGAHTIDLLFGLPEITDPVVIDATTQPGYAGAPLIELKGTLAGTSASGFSITAGGSTIRGLAIGGFSSSGINLSVNGNNVIQGNYIGTDPTGTLRRANHDGISLFKSSNNTIGGTTPAARNVISGNSSKGITINGSGNQISGNFIGTNAAGTAAINNGTGVETVNFEGSPSLNNVIGGTSAGNLISGNSTGIENSSATTPIQGNLIGTDISGTLSVPNGTGILVFANNGLVGGTVPGARNVISGNSGPGVRFSGTDGRLEGNFIGTDITGTLALGNGGDGVSTGRRTLIGGTSPEARNIISANGANGSANVFIDSNGDHSTVQGNYIGTDITGNVALNNQRPGISVQSSSNLIGGLATGARNIIAGNRVGIQIGGLVAPGPIENTIQGNFIGLNALGTAPLPNSFRGIEVSDSSDNVIGGTENGAANRIAFSGGPGVQVFSGFGNVVRGNSIFSSLGLGIDLAPTGITANDTGDADTGANKLQNFPLLTAVAPSGGGTAIQGTLHSAPTTVFRIDFYSSAACNASGNGEGGLYFDTTNVTTDADGNATISFTSSFALGAGRVLTATATDPAGNTSEFSRCDAANAAGSLQFNNAVYNVREEVGNAIITVVRVGGSKGTLSVNYNSADETATAGSDYTAVSGTLVFADGETSKTFAIPIVDDGVTEPAETARLALTAADLETLGSRAIATLNILPNNTPLVLDVNQINVPEGNGGATTAVVTVSLSAGTSQTVTANFSTVGSSATSGVDFTAVSGSLTFSPGITTQTISIPIINDSLNENDEEFGVILTNPTNASLGNSGSVLIVDDDSRPSVSISDVTVTEGNSGTVSAVFDLNLSVTSGRDVTVVFQTANGTATAGSDYVARFSSVVFPRGQTAKTISVTVNGDTTNEPDETFFVNLTFVDFATAADSQGIGTIINDDGPNGGSLNLSQTNYSVNEGAGSATITVNRFGGSAGEARVDYATSNGSATAGQDYAAASGTLIFPDGVTSQTFNVNITNDATTEPDETINLALTNAAGTGSLGLPTSAVLKIIDNDPPTISISDVIETEGNTSFFNAFLTVTLSGQTSQTVTVDYVTADGSATAGSDYQAGNGTVTFLPLQTVRVIAVRVNGDINFEPNETFNVNLSNPVNATINDAQGVGTIVNDDQPDAFISFSQSFSSVNESDGLTTITVNRSGDLSGPATVDYAATDNNGSATVVPCSTVNGNASSRCDFTAALGTLRFAAGESSKSFLVLISQDNYVEGAESLTLTLSNVTGNAGLATPSTASLTVADDATEPATNPIDTADAFVRQHYHDFLNREPDPAGLAFWSNQITECQQPGATCSAEVRRINVSAAFFLSIEFQETGYLVYRFYKSAYGNIAGAPVPVRLLEFLPDTQQIGKGVVIGQPGADQQLEANKVAYGLDFVTRSRFTTAYPTTWTPAQFVDALFTNAGVTPSTSDRDAAITEFGGAGNTTDTAARARALRRVAENSTLKQQETNKAFVLMQYFGYLRRNPNDPPEANLDFGGYNFWLGKLIEFNGNFVDAEMVKAFIISAEYRQRFGP